MRKSPLPSDQDHTSYLRRGGLAMVVIGIAGFFADYSLNIGLSRVLETHEYGDFKVARNFMVLFGSAVLLGGDRLCPKVVTGLLERNQHSQAWEYLRFYLLLSLGLSALVIAITWIFSYLVTGSGHPNNQHPVAWMVLGVPIMAAGALASRTLQSDKRPVRAILPWRVLLPLLVVGVVLFLARDRPGPSLEAVVIIAILSTLAITLWQMRDALRSTLLQLERDTASATPKRWLAASLPMTGFFLATLALAQSDIYFMEILGDEHEVGLYAAAQTTAHFLVLIQTIVVGLMAPLVSLAIESGPTASKKTRRQGFRLMLLALVPATVMLWLAGEQVLGLFGADYSKAGTALRYLMIGNFAWATAALTALWMQYTGRGYTVVIIAGVTLAVDSVLNLVLIPHYGMMGAATSTAFTYTLAGVALAVAGLRIVPPAHQSPQEVTER